MAKLISETAKSRRQKLEGRGVGPVSETVWALPRGGRPKKTYLIIITKSNSSRGNSYFRICRVLVPFTGTPIARNGCPNRQFLIRSHARRLAGLRARP